MPAQTIVHGGLLALDAPAEADRISAALRHQVFRVLRRRGVVVGLSGGVDSSVCAALCVRALGRERVLGLLMPEAESAPETLRLGRLVAESLGIETVVEDITAVLQAAGCYERRDAAIRTLVPEYGAGFRSKLVMDRPFTSDRYATFSVVVEAADGRQTRRRLTAEAYREIVAATNFKQRARKMMEYHHADRLQRAVAGTPNLPEFDQGFFVKNGDGAADVKPLAHLYKTQVYQLGGHLGIPDEILTRPPTTDTFSLEQSQEEFYFSLPYGQLDACLYGLKHHLSAVELAPHAELTPEAVDRVYRDIRSKRRTAAYLHQPALTIETGEAPSDER